MDKGYTRRRHASTERGRSPGPTPSATRASGVARPASASPRRWVKASRLRPLVPRETDRFYTLYRKRAAVEREFGRLKNEWALSPLRVRGVERVRLHTDLTILAKLVCALARTRAIPALS
jgi:DDE family transposase